MGFDTFSDEVEFDTIYYRVEGITKDTEKSMCGYIAVCETLLAILTELPPGRPAEEYYERALTKKTPEITTLIQILGVLGSIAIPDEYMEDQENRYCLCNDAFFEYVYPYLEELDKLAQKYTKLKLGYIDFKLDVVPYFYGEKADRLYENSRLITIHDADHCYVGHLNELKEALTDFFERL